MSLGMALWLSFAMPVSLSLIPRHFLEYPSANQADL
jgi:hypothetical protein